MNCKCRCPSPHPLLINAFTNTSNKKISHLQSCTLCSLFVWIDTIGTFVGFESPSSLAERIDQPHTPSTQGSTNHKCKMIPGIGEWECPPKSDQTECIKVRGKTLIGTQSQSCSSHRSRDIHSSHPCTYWHLKLCHKRTDHLQGHATNADMMCTQLRRSKSRNLG